jgi:uncharacterized protein YdeI (YjbR/CyaY-like superfamily)
MKDKEKVLEKQGPNTQNPSMIRFSGNTQVSDQKVVIISDLKEAMAYADAGISPAKVETDIEMLDELKEALDSDPELAEAFYSLTPGRQKSYLFNLNSAKQSETRKSRIIKFRDKIIAGKGAMERWTLKVCSVRSSDVRSYL